MAGRDGGCGLKRMRKTKTRKVADLVDVPIKVGISAFALGAVVALSEGHGELPPHLYPTPQPVAQLSVMASTTAASTSINLMPTFR
jgi:hypothetical protein